MDNTTIWIKQNTKQKLETFGLKNETYDQIINRLILTQTEIPIDLGLKWYRQATEAIPFFCGVPYYSFLRLFKQGHYFIIYDGKRNYGYWHYDEATEVATKLLNQQLIDTQHLSSKIEKWQKLVDKQIELEKEIKNLDKMSLQKLKDLFKRLLNIMEKIWHEALIIEFYDADSEEIILNILEKSKSSVSLKQFKTLATPALASLIQREHYDICKIGLKDDMSLLKAHAKNYFFIKNSWGSTRFLHESFFKEKLRRMKDESVNFKEEIEKIDYFLNGIKKEKEELMQKIRIERDVLIAAKFFEELTHWREVRKKYALISMYYLQSFLNEFAKKYKISKALLERASPYEIYDWKKAPIEELHARKKYIFQYLKGNKDITISGDLAKKYVEEVKKQNSNEKQRLYGNVANIGKIKGIAKIVITTEDVDKVNEGDILVAPATRPEYVPAMKKAAAIITDEGGITSHAAIVSRELKKPCIVGLQQATDVIKDGDEIFVNANHGVVEILDVNK